MGVCGGILANDMMRTESNNGVAIDSQSLKVAGPGRPPAVRLLLT